MSKIGTWLKPCPISKPSWKKLESLTDTFVLDRYWECAWRCWVAPAWVVYAPKDAPELLFLGAGRIFGIPVPILVFAIAAVAMQLFLSRTSIGRFIYAQGDNPEAARLTGIPLHPTIDRD